MVWTLIFSMGLLQAGEVHQLRDAMMWVESKGETCAYNAEEDAAGILQIRPIMVKEVNRICRLTGDDRRFFLNDRFYVEPSIEMWDIYSAYWCSRRNDFSLQGIARRWAGGTDGHTEDSSLEYWTRVRKRMKDGS